MRDSVTKKTKIEKDRSTMFRETVTLFWVKLKVIKRGANIHGGPCTPLLWRICNKFKEENNKRPLFIKILTNDDSYLYSNRNMSGQSKLYVCLFYFFNSGLFRYLHTTAQNRFDDFQLDNRLQIEIQVHIISFLF